MSKTMVPIAHFNEGRVNNPVKTGASMVFPVKKPSPLEVKPITSANNLEFLMR
jgi:hypothetical protein